MAYPPSTGLSTRKSLLLSYGLPQVVKAAADETPLTLAVLRDHIEKELSAEASLTADAAAKV